MVWGSSKREVLAQLPPGSGVTAIDVQSLTFIPGTLDDNPRMVDKDPKYRGKLLAMTRVNRARLLEGNWKVRAVSGSYFRRSDVKIVKTVPSDIRAVTRRWDLAATEPTDSCRDPDWTCGVKMGRYPDGRFIVMHVEMARKRANDVRALIKRLAEQDGESCSVGVPQDPAQAGKEQSESYVLFLAGFNPYADRETGDKETRAEPCAAQWQHGNIDVLEGAWNEQFFSQLEAFPDPKVHDDAVDALSGAFRRVLEDDDPFRYY